MVELLAVRRGEAKSISRARNSRSEPTLQMALKVEDQIEVPCTNLVQERNEGPRRVRAIVHDDLVEPRMALEQRSRFRLDGPRDMRVGPRAADPAKQRQGTDYIADGAEQDDQHAARRGCDMRGDGFSGGHRSWSRIYGFDS